ncbi:hypothetical protein, partial [Pseudomonas syringae]|uniref:hypothetical protein n=1 Tax=Pseudomonas syringae TaxID=317 RepID=UPI000AD3184E
GVGRQKSAGRRVFWTVEEERDFVAWCDANGFVDVADAATACLWTGSRQVDVAKAAVHELEGATWRYVPQKTERKGQEALAGILEPLAVRVARRRAEADAAPLRHLNATPYLWDYRMNRRHTSDTIGTRFREARRAAVAALAGQSDLAAFDARVEALLVRVNARYGELFEGGEDLDSRYGSLVFTGVENDPETLETLRRMGFSEPASVADAIRSWHHGRIPATRTERGRELFTRLAPR